MLRRSDFERASRALSSVGFIFHHVSGVDIFVDGPDGKPRDAVHVFYSGEKVRQEYLLPVPDVAESRKMADRQVLSLHALVSMKLNSWRLKDQVHLLDMIDVGLIDSTWLKEIPPELRPRLQDLLDHPDS